MSHSVRDLIFPVVCDSYQSSSILKTVKIYDSCLNTSAIESRGSSPLEKLIEHYGGWSVTGKGLNSWTVPKKMGRVLRDLNVQTLLRASVGTDFEDSSQHILNVSIAMVFCLSYHNAFTSGNKGFVFIIRTVSKINTLKDVQAQSST